MAAKKKRARKPAAKKAAAKKPTTRRPAAKKKGATKRRSPAKGAKGSAKARVGVIYSDVRRSLSKGLLGRLLGA